MVGQEPEAHPLPSPVVLHQLDPSQVRLTPLDRPLRPVQHQPRTGERSSTAAEVIGPSRRQASRPVLLVGVVTSVGAPELDGFWKAPAGFDRLLTVCSETGPVAHVSPWPIAPDRRGAVADERHSDLSGAAATQRCQGQSRRRVLLSRTRPPPRHRRLAFTQAPLEARRSRHLTWCRDGAQVLRTDQQCGQFASAARLVQVTDLAVTDFDYPPHPVRAKGHVGCDEPAS